MTGRVPDLGQPKRRNKVSRNKLAIRYAQDIARLKAMRPQRKGRK